MGWRRAGELSVVKAFKRALFGMGDLLHLPELSRRRFAGRILILAYHGISERPAEDLPWTMVNVGAFERQVAYLKEHYRILPLRQVVESLREHRPLPARIAVVTFDDGYRNNLRLALPVLRRYRAPATVFLTAGHIGGSRLLHFDRLYLSLVGARGVKEYPAGELGRLQLQSDPDRTRSFASAVSVFKRLPAAIRDAHLDRLEYELPGDETWRKSMAEELRIVTAEEVLALTRDGLIDVGAHTVTHQILANLDRESAAAEIGHSREILERIVQRPVVLFAYPNGQPGDFTPEHQEILRRQGFLGAVTTVPKLNEIHDGLFDLGRICVGPELAVDIHHFAMKISGVNTAVRSLLRSPHVFN